MYVYVGCRCHIHRQVPLNITYIHPVQKVFGTNVTLQVGATLLGCKKGETVASEKSKLQSAVALRMQDLASPSAGDQDGRDGARHSNTASSSFAKDVKHVLA